MTSMRARLSMLVVTLTLGACSATAGAPTSAPTQPPAATQPQAPVTLQATATTTVPSPTPAPTASPAASQGNVVGGSATPGPIDPCTLLTTAEASTLMGVQLGAGVSSTVDQDRECTFKKGLTEVKVILAPPASDVTTATGYWDAERAQVPAGFPVNDISLFDRAAYGSGSGAGTSLSALFVLKGTQAFDVYCGFPGCGENASAAAATLIGGRLP